MHLLCLWEGDEEEKRKRGVRGGKGRGGVRFCLLIIYYTDTAAQPDSPHKESRRKKDGGKRANGKV